MKTPTPDKYREAIVNFGYDLTETPVIVPCMGRKPIGWDIKAKHVHSDEIAIDSSVSRDLALQGVFEEVCVHDGYRNLDKPSRDEILCIFSAARILLENYGHPEMREMARDTAEIMQEILDRNEPVPTRKAAKKRKSKSRKS
jgi:hypothetical protein